MNTGTTGVRRSHRRASLVGTAFVGASFALLLGPLAGSASADTAYPPTDSCAAQVVPAASGSTASDCSTTDIQIEPTSSSRPAAVPSSTVLPTANTHNSGLAFTGADVPVAAGLGTLMVVGGVMMVVQSRRRNA